MKVTIDLDELRQLVQESGDIFLKPDGEQALLKLLEVQETIEQALAEAKRILEEEALKLNSNFTSLRADSIRIHYRAFGTKYGLDGDKLDDVSPELYSTKTTYVLNTKKIEAVLERTGELPPGIVALERPKQISFGLKEIEDGEG